MEEREEAIKRQDSLLFQTRVSPTKDNVEVELLTKDFKAEKEQSQVNVGETSHLVTGSLRSEGQALGGFNDNMARQNNRTRFASADFDSGVGRKKRKLDIGVMDEAQLNSEDDYDGETVEEDEVQPHDEQDTYFMNEAITESKNSPDEKVQVGAVVVDKSTGEILGRGYNRMPKGCEGLSWDDNERAYLGSKYPFVFHAVKVAMLAAFKQQKTLVGTTVYTTLFPANTDAQWIADCEIQELVYLNNTYKKRKAIKASQMILEKSGVKFRRIQV